MTSLRATYRLQLNENFTFADAMALVPYLHDLGISHLYLSPILQARAGSTHGYDTVNHRKIDEALGSLDEFRALARAVQQKGMGIVLDFVPNHMGVGGDRNDLWLDVLRHGPASRYADWFDIDWHPPHLGMDGKLLVPFLGTSYAEALSAGHLRLKADDAGLAVWAYDGDRLPVRPEDEQALLEAHGSAEAAVAAHSGKAGSPQTWLALDALIARQHWRLAHFSVAADEINYRRFFVNSDLAGIRIDRPEVFEHAHALIFQLIEEGLVDGLRIDHIDGLLDPKVYLETLRARCPRPIYLVVEKILAPHEPLRPDWPVDGTTGYEVGTHLTRVLMRPEAEAAVTDAYSRFTGATVGLEQEVYRCKVRVMDNELTAELLSLSRRLAAIAWSSQETRDLTQEGLRRALRETVAQLSVYRTYADDAGFTERDRREIGRAVALGRSNELQVQPAVFDFLEALLCGDLGSQYDPKAVAEARGRIQQYTGPVMAKGFEDTALYRFNRLVALNEVGAHPDRFAMSIAAFHDANQRRLESHPHSMIATSTHDTKRGEDTRALIAGIASDPQSWSRGVEEWTALLEGAEAIDRNDLYLFFQLLQGGWPIAGDVGDLADRLKGAMEKSLREARQRSDWGVNNAAYETEVNNFVDAAPANRVFRDRFAEQTAPLRAIGRRKALIQAGLKLTIPGLPDTYRGAEDWEQSFVDPDNRRPVDFAALAQRLADPEPQPDEKLLLTRSLLQLRQRLPGVFAEGSYEPIDCGADAIGYRRAYDGNEVVVLADLSPLHDKGLSFSGRLRTVWGSATDPIWVLST